MSGTGNNVQGSTIFTDNTVLGGPNDVTVQNLLVQGDLTVLGDTIVAEIEIENAQLNGGATVNGLLTVNGNIDCTGVVQAEDGFITAGDSYLAGNVNVEGVVSIGGTAGALNVDGAGYFSKPVTIDKVGTGGPGSGTALTVGSDARINGNLFVSGSALVSGEVVSFYNPATPPTLTDIQTFTNVTIAAYNTPYLLASAKIIDCPIVIPVNLTFSNLQFQVIPDNSAASVGKQGQSSTLEYKYGIVKLPWNGVVDSRFTTGSPYQYSWQALWNSPGHANAWWTYAISSKNLTFPVSATVNGFTNDSYGVIAICTQSDPYNTVINNDLTSTMDNHPEPELVTISLVTEGQTGSSVPAYLNVFMDPAQYPSASLLMYAVGSSLTIGTNNGAPNYEPVTFNIQILARSTTGPTPYARYHFNYNTTLYGPIPPSGTPGISGFKAATIRTSNPATFVAASNGALVPTISAVQSTTAERVVDVGKTFTLDRAANVIGTGATLAVNNVQNLTGTSSFTTASVAQLNAGFTTDRRNAVLNANNPTGTNPFATIADITAAGGAVPGGSVTGAVQFRSSTGTFTADNDYTYESATKRQRITTAGSTIDVQPTAITMTSAAAGGSATPMLKMENTNAAAGSVFIETYKNKNGVAGDVVGNWSCFGKNASGSKREFSRIATTIRQAGAGQEDGSVGISVMRDNVVSEYARFNGNEGQIEMYQPLDMNSHNITNVTGIIGPTTLGIGSTAVFTEYQVKDPTIGTIAAINYNGFTNTLIMGGTLQPGAGIRDNSGSTGAGQFLSADPSGNLLWTGPPVISYSGLNGIGVDPLGPTISIVNSSGGISFLDGTGAAAPINGISVVNAAVFQPTGAAGGYFDVGMLSTSGTSGGNTGLHLPIRINGTQYKIRLEAD